MDPFGNLDKMIFVHNMDHHKAMKKKSVSGRRADPINMPVKKSVHPAGILT